MTDTRLSVNDRVSTDGKGSGGLKYRLNSGFGTFYNIKFIENDSTMRLRSPPITSEVWSALPELNEGFRIWRHIPALQRHFTMTSWTKHSSSNSVFCLFHVYYWISIISFTIDLNATYRSGTIQKKNVIWWNKIRVYTELIFFEFITIAK